MLGETNKEKKTKFKRQKCKKEEEKKDKNIKIHHHHQPQRKKGGKRRKVLGRQEFILLSWEDHGTKVTQLLYNKCIKFLF